MPHIAIIANDPAPSRALASALEAAGFSVTTEAVTQAGRRLQYGDINLTFKRYLEKPIRLEIVKDFVVDKS